MEPDKPAFDYPSLSIIIPAHNEEKCIQGRIENLLDLVYPRDKLELIIVDDGSTDRTFEYAEKYPVKVIHIEHGGPARAKNVGLEFARGELVSFQDANDLIWDRNYLNKIVGVYLKTGKSADIVLIRTKSFPATKSFLGQAIFLREHPQKIRWDSRNSTVMREFKDISVFRRDFYSRIGGYDSKLGAFEDVAMAYKFAKEKPRIVESDDETMKAEGGATVSVRGFMERYLWRGRAVFGLWKYDKRRTILISSYALYFGVLLTTLLAGLIGLIPMMMGASLVTLFLSYTLSRILVMFSRIRKLSLLVLIPILDFLHGTFLFLGLAKGLIYKILGKYTPYK